MAANTNGVTFELARAVPARYRGAADPGDRHPRLALDHGLAVHRASL
jgi:hypothetical protein